MRFLIGQSVRNPANSAEFSAHGRPALAHLFFNSRRGPTTSSRAKFTAIRRAECEPVHSRNGNYIFKSAVRVRAYQSSPDTVVGIPTASEALRSRPPIPPAIGGPPSPSMANDIAEMLNRAGVSKLGTLAPLRRLLRMVKRTSVQVAPTRERGRRDGRISGASRELGDGTSTTWMPTAVSSTRSSADATPTIASGSSWSGRRSLRYPSAGRLITRRRSSPSRRAAASSCAASSTRRRRGSLAIACACISTMTGSSASSAQLR